MVKNFKPNKWFIYGYGLVGENIRPCTPLDTTFLAAKPFNIPFNPTTKLSKLKLYHWRILRRANDLKNT